MNWKKTLTYGGIAVGAYLAYRWYQKDKAKRLAAGGATTGVAGLGAPVWYGYGKTKQDLPQAKAYGAETSETAASPMPPNVVVGDADEAPEGAAFTDEDEFTQDPNAF